MVNFARNLFEGDSRERLTCLDCGHVFYENPKVIVASVIEHDGRVLLCRRAIEPRRGFWTLPAGYMELGETLAEGAAREAYEEANALIEIEGVLALYSISRINQVQVIHRARFTHGLPHIAPGEESLDARLFPIDEIPWDELAFPSVHWALDAWLASRGGPLGAPATNPITDPRGVVAPELSATFSRAAS
jgi:ADP-ribose pyrophosphatase YjhB (NUDIX family)